MKNIYKWLIAVCCCFTFLAGCNTSNSASPTEVTKAFLNSYHDHEQKGIDTYSNWTTFDASSLELTSDDYLQGVDEHLQQEVYQKMLEFSHVEDSEEIKDDSATVMITLTLYDFAPVVEQGLREATNKTQELAQRSDISDEEIQAQILTVLFEHMNKAEQNKKITVKVNLIKQSGSWLVSNDNDDLQAALLTNTQAVEKIA